MSAVDGWARAIDDANRAGDDPALVEAARGLIATLGFGVDPGRAPGMLYEVYRSRPDGPTRAALAVALARAWVYGGEPDRAQPFAAEAVQYAEHLDDPGLLVDALDAALLTRWGPDDATERTTLAQRITLAAAHIRDRAQRSTAALWRLTGAMESLDSVAVLRALRVLDGLADETGDPRDRFFADSRRAMYALAAGDLAVADPLIESVSGAGVRAGIVDAEAVVRSLAAQRAWQAGDRIALAREAALFEGFGLTEAIPSILAEAAVFWCGAGELDRAQELLDRLVGDSLAAVPRDVDWLLTVTMLARVAVAVGRLDAVGRCVELLVPYARHAVLNAGAVTFHGVVADVLASSARLLGDEREQHWREQAADGYRRLGARWWLAALQVPASAAPTQVLTTPRMLFRRAGDRLWMIGAEGSSVVLPDMRGLGYLHTLLANPGVDVESLALAAGGNGAPDTDAGQMIDDRARAAYRRRLGDLESELDEAVAWSDPERATRLSAERDALIAELAAATGLGGRARVAGSTAERARVAVRKAIAAALERIGAHDPALARLLRDGVRTGRVCRYEPDPGRRVTWVLR